MNINIDQLRHDLRLTAAREGWSEDEALEVGTAIKAAIDAADDETLAYWAGELSWWREMLSGFSARLRAFEASVRNERKQEATR